MLSLNFHSCCFSEVLLPHLSIWHQPNRGKMVKKSPETSVLYYVLFNSWLQPGEVCLKVIFFFNGFSELLQEIFTFSHLSRTGFIISLSSFVPLFQNAGLLMLLWFLRYGLSLITCFKETKHNTNQPPEPLFLSPFHTQNKNKETNKQNKKTQPKTNPKR